MKIVLVNPPLTPKRQAGSFKEIANILPTLGIGYIAAILEKRNFDVEIIDCIPEGVGIEELSAILIRKKPALLGFTATVLTINTAIEYAKKLRNLLPKTVFVIGGPQVSSAPQETMERGNFDIGVIGEGELTFLELAEQIREDRLSLGNIRGVVHKENGRLVFNAPRPYIEDLDFLPFPARHLFPPLNRYKPIFASYRKLPLGHMISSRGCPYQCIFCDRKVFGNKFRAHSPEYVVEEMEELVKKHGAREIKFFDDTFTLLEERVGEICEEIIKRKINVPWSCLTRVDRVSRDLLKLMKRAGCWQVVYGLESGSPEILEKIKKGTTIEEARNAVKWSQDAKLSVRATFVLGLPGETETTIKQTVQFAKELNLDFVTFFTLVLYPGNELYEVVKREGKILHDDYTQYTSIIDAEETRLHFIPEGMTEEELKKAIFNAYKKYYLRPRYVLKELFSIRSFTDILRYWSGVKTFLQIKRVATPK